MGVHIVNNKLVITAEPKAFCIDLPNDAENNFEHEIDFIIKHNELLDEQTIKEEVRQLLSKYKDERRKQQNK